MAQNSSSWHKNAFSSLLLACLFAIIAPNSEARELEFVLEEVESLRDRIQERARQQIEDRIQSTVSSQVQDQVDEAIGASVESTVIDNVTAQVPLPPESSAPPIENRIVLEPQAKLKNDDPIGAQLDRAIESKILDIENKIDLAVETVRDEKGRTALSHQWLVLADQEGLDKLAASGYEIVSVEDLSGLGFLLGTIKAPRSHDPEKLHVAQIQVVETPSMAVDLNHVYLPQKDSSPQIPNTSSKGLPDLSGTGATVIGMIDSSINRDHPVFSDSLINEAIFTPKGFRRAEGHGTAIASILVGKSEHYTGLSPGSTLFNGVVFATDERGNQFSTTASIVRAMNWLVEKNTRVINMSLAGPDNAILKAAVQSACDRGIIVVSAVGNAGPAAPPLYPSAYNCTIAVTGVDTNGNPYHRANRGDHVEFALPGVDVDHASASGGYTRSSGTSYAAAILSGIIAGHLAENQLQLTEVRSLLSRKAVDLGDRGIDPIYGEGWLKPTAYISD